MKRKHIALVTLSTITAVTAAVLAYGTKVQPSDPPQWLTTSLIAHRAALAITLLVMSAFGALIDWIRAYVSERSNDKALLQRLLDDFARQQFKTKVKKNRLTVFQATSGFRCFCKALFRLPLFEKRYKWKAAWRLKFRQQYLGVYVRSAEARNAKSTAALRISDDADECEGMAGLTWEETFCIVPNLPKLDPNEVRQVTSLESLPFDHPIRQYARATNVKDLVVLKSMEHFGRHFMGMLIRRSNGTPWGVILLDSEEDSCPFDFGNGGGPFADKLADCARVFGKIII